MLLFPAVNWSWSCASCVFCRYSQPVRRSSSHQDGLFWGGPWQSLPVSGAAERICHGSAARGRAAWWRRGNLCLHISHIHIVQPWAATCSRCPSLSPQQQNLHRPENLLQKVSIFSVLQVPLRAHGAAHPMKTPPSAVVQEVKCLFPDERWSLNITSENRMWWRCCWTTGSAL